MARVFAVASAKGGVGKTTTTANVGAILAETGADVVVIDGDIGMANLGAALGITSETTIHDVLSGEASVSQATVEGPGGLYVVPGDTALSAYADADPTELKSVLQTHSQADYVLIDVGAGISHESSLPLSLADEVLLVSTPDRDALLDTEKTRQLTEQLGGTVAGAVITRSEPTTPISELVTGTLGTDVLATIPEDEAVQESLAVGEPLALYAPHSPAAAGYRKLVAELTGIEPPEPPEAESTAEPDAETASTTVSDEPADSSAVDSEPAPESPADMPDGAAAEGSDAAPPSDTDSEPPAEAESKWAEAATGSGIDTEESTPEADDDSQSVTDDAIPFRDSAADAESESVAEAESESVAEAESEPAADAESEPVADAESEPVAEAESEPVADAASDSDSTTAADESAAVGVDGSDAVELPDSAESTPEASAESTDSDESADSDEPTDTDEAVESEAVEISDAPETSQDTESAADDGGVVIPDAEPAADTEPSEAVAPAGEEGAMQTELAAETSTEDDEDDEKKGFLRRLFFG